MAIEWSPIIAAGIGASASAGNSFLSSWLGNASSKKAQARAYNYWRHSLAEGPKLTRQGLEAAGYNPMLALGNIGGHAFSANSTPSFAPVGDMVGSAAAGARLGNQILRGIKLENEQKELQNKNLESDLDTKEVQRLQMEANESLLRSQTERSDLAYGRDIVGTAADIAGTAGSLYSAKAMSDVAKANAATAARNATVNERRLDTNTVEVKRDAKGRKLGEVERTHISAGQPTVKNTPKAKTPNVGGFGHSAKSVGKVAGELAKMVILPAALGGLAAEGVSPFVQEIKSQSREDIERNSRKSAIQFPLKRPMEIRFGM